MTSGLLALPVPGQRRGGMKVMKRGKTGRFCAEEHLVPVGLVLVTYFWIIESVLKTIRLRQEESSKHAVTDAAGADVGAWTTRDRAADLCLLRAEEPALGAPEDRGAALFDGEHLRVLRRHSRQNSRKSHQELESERTKHLRLHRGRSDVSRTLNDAPAVFKAVWRGISWTTPKPCEARETTAGSTSPQPFLRLEHETG